MAGTVNAQSSAAQNPPISRSFQHVRLIKSLLSDAQDYPRVPVPAGDVHFMVNTGRLLLIFRLFPLLVCAEPRAPFLVCAPEDPTRAGPSPPFPGRFDIS